MEEDLIQPIYGGFSTKSAKRQAYVIQRRDLVRDKKHVSFNEISYHDLPGSMRDVSESDYVMFVEPDGSTRVLKNRYGSSGVIVSSEQYENYIRLLKKEADEALKEIQKITYENNKLGDRTKKKSFLGRIFKKRS